MTDQKARGMWVAYGTNGVVGSIRLDDEGYTVTMARAETATGVYPTLEVAKGALISHVAPGSPRPEFREH